MGLELPLHHHHHHHEVWEGWELRELWGEMIQLERGEVRGKEEKYQEIMLLLSEAAENVREIVVSRIKNPDILD